MRNPNPVRLVLRRLNDFFAAACRVLRSSRLLCSCLNLADSPVKPGAVLSAILCFCITSSSSAMALSNCSIFRSALPVFISLSVISKSYSLMRFRKLISPSSPTSLSIHESIMLFSLINAPTISFASFSHSRLSLAMFLRMSWNSASLRSSLTASYSSGNC